MRQYAAQHELVRERDGARTAVPWIDENLHPDRPDWIARTMVRREGGIRERGKDYNHSTFCDLVVTGLCGFVPDGDGGSASILSPTRRGTGSSSRTSAGAATTSRSAISAATGSP